MMPTPATESALPVLREALEGLQSAVAAGGNVLICGEPGAGHERLAKAIHLESAAGDRPLVVVDCSRAGDIERRLLGSPARASSTSGDGPECIESGCELHTALSGTLILRHVTDLPRRVQTKLERILRDDEVEVAGRERTETIRAGIRGIATVEAQSHREGLRDLQAEFLKRLSTTIIDLPPLRERRQEIPSLAGAFLRRACHELGIQQKELSPHASELLAALEWRGNVDELAGAIWSLATNVSAVRIRMGDVLDRIKFEGRATMLFGGTLREARARFEREYVAHVLEQHNNHMTEAARVLGIQRTNLYRKVRQLALDRRKVSR